MKNAKGFTLIEALVAMSVVMMLVVTIIPIDLQIKQERKILFERRIVISMLHDELQQIVWDHKEPQSETRALHDKKVFFEYSYEYQLIKGCATWENVKQQRETICLYGYE